MDKKLVLAEESFNLNLIIKEASVSNYVFKINSFRFLFILFSSFILLGGVYSQDYPECEVPDLGWEDYKLVPDSFRHPGWDDTQVDSSLLLNGPFYDDGYNVYLSANAVSSEGLYIKYHIDTDIDSFDNSAEANVNVFLNGDQSWNIKSIKSYNVGDNKDDSKDFLEYSLLPYCITEGKKSFSIRNRLKYTYIHHWGFFIVPYPVYEWKYKDDTEKLEFYFDTTPPDVPTLDLSRVNDDPHLWISENDSLNFRTLLTVA